MMSFRQLVQLWLLVSGTGGAFFVLDQPNRISTANFWIGVLLYLLFSSAVCLAAESWARMFLPALDPNPRRRVLDGRVK